MNNDDTKSITFPLHDSFIKIIPNLSVIWSQYETRHLTILWVIKQPQIKRRILMQNKSARFNSCL